MHMVFCVLFFDYVMNPLCNFMIHLSIFFMVVSLTLGQPYDCPWASEITSKDIVYQIGQYLTTTKHNKH